MSTFSRSRCIFFAAYIVVACLELSFVSPRHFITFILIAARGGGGPELWCELGSRYLHDNYNAGFDEIE